MHCNNEKQSGFIVLMGMLMLVLGAAAWFATYGSLQSNAMKLAKNDKGIAQLQHVKDKFLAYAAAQPEVYSDSANVPGPGYFPCPDEDGDGDVDTQCDVDSSGVNRTFVLGKVPYKIGTRYFTFLDSRTDNSLFWYAVDARFVNSSARYATSTSQRLSDLNINLPATVTDVGGATVSPLTLDGRNDIVMVLFYAGEPVLGQNRPSNSSADYLEQGSYTEGYTKDFKSISSSNFNDYVIAITRKEWESAVLSRVSQDTSPEDGVPDMCVDVIDTDVSWFNECKYLGTNVPPFACTNIASGSENITGQDWRTIICP